MLSTAGDRDEVIEFCELSYSAQRRGRSHTVTLALRHPSHDLHFETVDLLAPALAELSAPFAQLRRELADIPDEARLGLTGVVLPPEDVQDAPALFTISVFLTDATEPGNLGADGDIVTLFDLAGFPGQRHAVIRTLEGEGGAQLPFLTVTYATITPESTLVLTFGTPHAESAGAMLTLFDAIAASTTLR